MTTQSNNLVRTNKIHLTVLFASSLFITLLLFYIDEGHYNFNWMSRIGNWIPFIVYIAAIFSGQLLFSKLLLKEYHGPGKTLLSVLGGAAVGMLVVIFGIFNSW